MLDQPLRDQPPRITPFRSATGRRLLFFALVGLTIAGMVYLLASSLAAGGISPIDLLLIALFTITLPWSVIGFWNAVIGLLIMRLAEDPAASVLPAAGLVKGTEPITTSTALALCIRNEPPDRVVRCLEPLLSGLADQAVGAHFNVYVLSDTDDPTIAAAEEACFTALAEAWRDRISIRHRRRTDNAGYKAGNIRDFGERWGPNHEFVVILDADSVMTANAVLRLVRIMQIDPRLGILQSLVTGLPSASAFTRIFQFGMRLAMRSYTIGSAWWQADCGPFWGHNAIVRLAPFMAHCELPTLSEGSLVGGHVLSHDQIEAVLMRRAGYEVRVLTDEGGSFEQNPPTLVEFARRDMRWCQGNMQYWHFLMLPGLKPISRYQLIFAILMFLGSPAWICLLLAGSAAAAWSGSAEGFIRTDIGLVLLAITILMLFAPNLATAIDVMSRPEQRRAFGGGLRFCTGVAIQILFMLMLLPIMWFGHTLFLTRLLLGRRIGWGTQARDDHTVPTVMALRQFWPQTLFGVSVIAILAATWPAAIPVVSVMAGGLALSIPFAVLTATPGLGLAMVRTGLCGLPEEIVTPAAILALDLPAIKQPPPSTSQPHA
jgi:membrane glycosyltransferase